MDYRLMEILKRLVINFLVYNKGCDLKEANEIFSENLECFESVFEILGEDLITIIGRNIDDGSKK